MDFFLETCQHENIDTLSDQDKMWVMKFDGQILRQVFIHSQN